METESIYMYIFLMLWLYASERGRGGLREGEGASSHTFFCKDRQIYDEWMNESINHINF